MGPPTGGIPWIDGIKRAGDDMSSRALLVLAVSLVAGQGRSEAQAPKAAERYRPTAPERAGIEAKGAELAGAIEAVRPKVGEGPGGRDALADVAVCHKAAAWALRFGEFFEAKDVERVLKVLDRGLDRAKALAEGRAPWAEAAGGTVRGYRSRVDGSVQPYAVVVPSGKGGGDGEDRLRLDVVLHGRDARIQEARFFDAHDGKAAPAGLPGLVLHVFGRGNNAYRWAGEADVYEAIEAVKRNYRVDERRVVLRGFSMGGAGAWHLGLHDPSRWSSVEAGAGFSETIEYAGLKDPSEVVRKGLHIYDAVDYARNASDVPIVGYGGEDDPQVRASENIERALVALGVPMKREGLATRAEGPDFLRLVGKGMGHAVDPASAALMKAFHDERAIRGSDPYPTRVRFATYTLRYNRVAWLEIERLAEHFRRATLEGEIDGDLATVRTEDVASLAVARQAGATLRLDGREFPLREAVGGLLPDVYFRKGGGGWEILDHDASLALQRNDRGEKRPGVQGPIDDAFAGPFLCVRGTGTPRDPRVQAWADARLAGFADDWARSFRGDLPVIDDLAVTPRDIEESHLILFGDPGSNRLIARVLPDLPLIWTSEEITLAGAKFPAADHAPVLVAANPWNRLRYVGINARHTFGAKDFAGTNALLYPRLGDHAVIKIGESEEVVANGFFNERWR